MVCLFESEKDQKDTKKCFTMYNKVVNYKDVLFFNMK